jgi:hypothetical protein
MLDIVLVAKGLEPEKVTTRISREDLQIRPRRSKELRQYAEATLALPRSRHRSILTKRANVARLATIGPQKRDQLLETQNKYLQQNLEMQQGDSNPGVRLACIFQRKAGSITSAYDILADKALSEVFRTTFNLPTRSAPWRSTSKSRSWKNISN